MRSQSMKKGVQRAAARSLLKSIGLNQSEIDKPWIAVVNSYTEIVPGHIHLNKLINSIKEGIWIAGGVPFEFNTIAVCDGIAQGTNGMKFSLPSRETIVDSIEIMVEAHGFDGMVLVPSCDKTIPADLMAAARLNIPSIIVTGGPMLPGIYESKEISLVEMREFIGEYKEGKISEEDLFFIEDIACPTAGSCSMLGTANTMAAISETIGMSLPGCATSHAVMSQKYRLARMSGIQIIDLVKNQILPREIMTREALINGITLDMALGGSLNSIIHITDLANELEINQFSLRIFDELSRITPVLCSLKPSGRNSIRQLDLSGGIPAVLKELSRHNRINSGCLTVTGKSIDENLEDYKIRPQIKTIIHKFKSPVRDEGGIAILFGNLAPEGAVIKQIAVDEDLCEFEGIARVFNSLETGLQALWNDEILSGEIMVVRYEGPIGSPGMREQHSISSLISGSRKKIALVTDGRFSGSSRGAVIGHVSPEAARSGPIGVVKEGDIISYSLKNRTLTLEIDEQELKTRLSKFKPQPQKIVNPRSVLSKYRKILN